MKNEIKKQMLIRGFGSMPTGIAVGFLILACNFNSKRQRTVYSMLACAFRLWEVR